jgi:hypothetical protein
LVPHVNIHTRGVAGKLPDIARVLDPQPQRDPSQQQQGKSLPLTTPTLKWTEKGMTCNVQLYSQVNTTYRLNEIQPKECQLLKEVTKRS